MPRVGWAAIVAIAAGLLLLGLWALVFARASSAGWVAERSAELVHLDSISADIDVTHERVRQAVILAAAAEAGVATTEIAAGAADDVERRLSALDAFSVPEVVAPLLTSYVEAGRRALAALDATDLATAARLVNGELPSIGTDLIAALNDERVGLSMAIEQARSDSALLTTVAGFIVVLLVPTVGLVAYRQVARRQLSRAEEEARHAADRELATRREQFIAGVSHELRTPLTSIYGLSSVLADRGRLDRSDEAELMEMLVDSASDMTRMVDDLIVSARHETGDLTFSLTRVHIADLMNEAAQAIDRLSGPIQVLLDEPDAEVIADPLRFRHMLRNLIDNADRHGGPNVRLVGRRVGERYRIEVADDGEGIPDHRVDRLFEPFVHTGTAPLTTGTVGLGLSVVRALADGMGANIRYERDSGWSRIIVELEAIQGDLAVGMAEEAAAHG